MMQQVAEVDLKHVQCGVVAIGNYQDATVVHQSWQIKFCQYKVNAL